MVHKRWISFKEKFHGDWYDMWRNMTLKGAKRLASDWNAYDNPEEHLAIVAVTDRKPNNLVKSRYKGIYHAKS